MLKKILDPCCGSRMFYFNKDNPDVLFGDIRKESHILCDGRKLEINPDQVLDFRNLPFENETFHLVVFDPPHLVNLGQNSWMSKKYGVLNKNWQSDIKKGFDECMRVLKPNSTLIFKWNQNQIKIKELLKVIKTQPVFGHTSGRNGLTIWMTFFKNPTQNDLDYFQKL
jgi:SAM-dependent methyltransferase